MKKLLFVFALMGLASASTNETTIIHFKVKKGQVIKYKTNVSYDFFDLKSNIEVVSGLQISSKQLNQISSRMKEYFKSANNLVNYETIDSQKIDNIRSDGSLEVTLNGSTNFFNRKIEYFGKLLYRSDNSIKVFGLKSKISDSERLVRDEFSNKMRGYIDRILSETTKFINKKGELDTIIYDNPLKIGATYSKNTSSSISVSQSVDIKSKMTYFLTYLGQDRNYKFKKEIKTDQIHTKISVPSLENSFVELTYQQHKSLGYVLINQNGWIIEDFSSGTTPIKMTFSILDDQSELKMTVTGKLKTTIKQVLQ